MAGVFIPESFVKIPALGQIQIFVQGEITRDFIIPASGSPVSDIPGGSALFFAAGAALIRNDRIGVVATVGDDFPLAALENLADYGIDLTGIRILPHPLDNRRFHSALARSIPTPEPAIHYLASSHELPRTLLGYSPNPSKTRLLETRQKQSLPRIPTDYLRSSLAHTIFWNEDLQSSHAVLQQLKYSGKISQYIGRISAGVTQSERMISSLHNLLCVQITWQALHRLFDLADSAPATALQAAKKIRSEFVVVFLGDQGRLLLETQSGKNWFLPCYPLRNVNPAGINHSFCGAFCATLHQSYDPLEAAQAGTVIASIAAEGVGLEHLLGVSPRLIDARLHRLRGLVRRI